MAPKNDSSTVPQWEQASRDARIEELQQGHDRQNREVAPAELSTGGDERRDPSLRLPVRALGEYVFGGRVDAMRRLLCGR